MKTASEILEEASQTGRLGSAYLAPVRQGTNLSHYGLKLASKIVCAPPESTCKRKVQRKVHPDCHWSKPDNQKISINDIKEIQHNARQSPVEADRKVYILAPADKLSRPAANSLLKILEEPPEFVFFLLITQEISSLPATILSRCHRLPSGGLSKSDIVEKLRDQGFDSNEARYMSAVINYRADLLDQDVDQQLSLDSVIPGQQEFPQDMKGLAESITNSENLLEIHETTFELLSRLPKAQPHEIISIAEKLSQGTTTEVKFLLHKIALICRQDLLSCCKNEQPTLGLPGEFSPDHQTIRQLIKGMTALDQNANAQLLLESLLFKLIEDEDVVNSSSNFYNN